MGLGIIILDGEIVFPFPFGGEGPTYASAIYGGGMITVRCVVTGGGFYCGTKGC